jgi:PAS domain S-box-containing protein
MARGVAERVPGKRPVRLFGSLQDITERKQAEETLRQEKQFSESLVDTAQMIVLVLNTSGQIVTFNPYMEEISGYKLEESIGKDWFSTFLPEANQAEIRNLFSIALTDIKTKGNIDEILTKDGRILSIEWYDKALKDSTGNMVGLLSVGQDITERRLSSEKLVKSYESLKKTLNDAINTMVKIVETRDPYTAGHQQKVACLATAIAGEMKLEDTRIDQLRMAATIHDIGKLYIPSDILSRPGKLTDIELGLIKTHCQHSYDIVKGMDFPGVVAQSVLQHHERLDGSGYPNQLKGEDTLLEAKILAVADVVEAMASHRPYRQALGIDKALEEISHNRGKLYDPVVVDACMKLFKESGFKFTE